MDRMTRRLETYRLKTFSFYNNLFNCPNLALSKSDAENEIKFKLKLNKDLHPLTADRFVFSSLFH